MFKDNHNRLSNNYKKVYTIKLLDTVFTINIAYIPVRHPKLQQEQFTIVLMC